VVTAALAAAFGADPRPASLENMPRLTPVALGATMSVPATRAVT
jgi:hypothetical protein